MPPEERSYRYLLRLVPECPADQGDVEGTPVDPVPGGDQGWEFVQSRVDDDGSELLVFRRPA